MSNTKEFTAIIQYRRNAYDPGLTELHLTHCVWVKNHLAQRTAVGIMPVFVKGINASDKTEHWLEQLASSGGLTRDNYTKYLPFMLKKGLQNQVLVRESTHRW